MNDVALRTRCRRKKGDQLPPRWTHITITVANFERSMDFYRKFCGLVIVRDRRKPAGGGTVWLGSPPVQGELPRFVLVLMEGQVTTTLDHLGFQAGDRHEVDEAAEKARQLGILVDPPTDSGGAVGYWTTIRDPDGHFVEITFGQPISGV
jgi:catechol 2,3-dioxygenase-like lactoylglutathione lyase family enzyme